MTKRCSFVFGGQQYDETVQFCVWRAAVRRNCAVWCSEGSSMTILVTLGGMGELDQEDAVLRVLFWDRYKPRRP
jgi:hypothetical protein